MLSRHCLHLFAKYQMSSALDGLIFFEKSAVLACRCIRDGDSRSNFLLTKEIKAKFNKITIKITYNNLIVRSLSRLCHRMKVVIDDLAFKISEYLNIR